MQLCLCQVCTIYNTTHVTIKPIDPTPSPLLCVKPTTFAVLPAFTILLSSFVVIIDVVTDYSLLHSRLHLFYDLRFFLHSICRIISSFHALLYGFIIVWSASSSSSFLISAIYIYVGVQSGHVHIDAKL